MRTLGQSSAPPTRTGSTHRTGTAPIGPVGHCGASAMPGEMYPKERKTSVAQAPAEQPGERRDHHQETGHADSYADRHHCLRGDGADQQQRQPEQEPEAARERSMVPNLIQVDTGCELRVVVEQRSLDLLERALLILGQRHGRSYRRSGLSFWMVSHVKR